jgi:hypothetical protein
MVRRRAIFDPLEPTNEPRRLVVRNMHEAVLESRPLPPWVDLKRARSCSLLRSKQSRRQCWPYLDCRALRWSAMASRSKQ